MQLKSFVKSIRPPFFLAGLLIAVILVVTSVFGFNARYVSFFTIFFAVFSILFIFMFIRNVALEKKILFVEKNEELHPKEIFEEYINNSAFNPVLELGDMGYYILFLDSLDFELGSSLCKILGISDTVMNLSTFSEMMHPDDLFVLIEREKNSKKAEIGVYYFAEFRFIHPEKGVLWLKNSYTYKEHKGVSSEIGFMKDITEQKQAEHALEYERMITHALLSLSSKYINVNYEEIEAAISDILNHFGVFFKADRASICKYNFEKNTYMVTNEWCAEGVSSFHVLNEDKQLDVLSPLLRYHEKGEQFMLNKIQSLEDEKLKAHLASQGIKSFLSIPLFIEKKLIGFLGVETFKKRYDFKVIEPSLFGVFADVLSNIIQRQRTERELYISSERQESLIRVAKYQIKERDAFVKYVLHEIVKLTDSPIAFVFIEEKKTEGLHVHSWMEVTEEKGYVFHTDKTAFCLDIQLLLDEVADGKTALIELDKRHLSINSTSEGMLHLDKVACVPLFSKGEVIGVVGIGKKEMKYEEAVFNHLSLIVDSLWKILERFESRQRIKTYQQNLELILNSIPLGIVIRDINTNEPIFINTTLCEMLEISKEDFYATDAYNFYKDKNERDVIIDNLQRGKKVYGKDIKFIKQHSGDEFWSKTSAFKQNYFNKETILFCFFDLTIAKELQIKLEGAILEAHKANEAKNVFLANMSHEIRTPLNAIIGFADILENKVDDLASSHYLSSIKTSGRTLLNLINDILDFSKIEAGYFELSFSSFSIRRVVQELSEIFREKAIRKGLLFNVLLDDSIPNELLLDELRLKQVLMNLISNALKFTEKGSVSLIIENRQCSPTKSDITFRVVDTGIGIKKSEQKRIFEAFKQQQQQDNRMYGGTGLGLSISNTLVEMMGGKIEMMSKVGEGSTFYFTIKDISTETSLVTESNDIGNYSDVVFSDARILVIDQIESNRLVIKGLLEDKGVLLLEANSIELGIEMAQEEIPDLILFDTRTGDMKDWEAIKELKNNEKTKHIPIVSLLVSDNEIEIQKTIAYQVEKWLVKPIDIKKLITILANYLSFQNRNEQSMYEKTLKKKEVLLDEPLFTTFCTENRLFITKYLRNQTTKNLVKLANQFVEFGKKENSMIIQSEGEIILEAYETFNVEKLDELMIILNDLFKQVMNNDLT